MIIDIPGYKKLQITTLLLDYNGTIGRRWESSARR